MAFVYGPRALQQTTGDTRAYWGTGSQFGALPAPRFQHSTVAVDGKLMVVGGTDGRVFFEDIHIYDPVSMVWTAYWPASHNEDESGGRARHTIVYIPEQGAVYMYGGICAAGLAPATLFVMHPVDDLTADGTYVWRSVPTSTPPPASRFSRK